jgi:hypothetical protein
MRIKFDLNVRPNKGLSEVAFARELMKTQFGEEN